MIPASSSLFDLLIGGALGDAYGGAYEGQPNPILSEFPSHVEVSDDTQLTLATCEALSADRSKLPEAVAQAMLKWYRAGRLSGLGASTTKALQELNMGGHWALVGRKGEHAAGNGAAMRIAPLAFLEPELDRQTIRDVCRITHHSEEAYVGALAIFLAVRHWQPDKPQRFFLSMLLDELPDTRVRDCLAEIKQADETTLFDWGKKFGSSGYVVESVPLALMAAEQAQGTAEHTAQIFSDLVRLGGDTDTNCFLAGQLIGVKFGLAAFPAAWIDRLRQTPTFALIENVAKRGIG